MNISTQLTDLSLRIVASQAGPGEPGGPRFKGASLTTGSNFFTVFGVQPILFAVSSEYSE